MYYICNPKKRGEYIMAGQIKKTIDSIIDQKAKGDQALIYLMQAKLALKGINVKQYDDHSEDDPLVLERLQRIADDFGVVIN
jgi:hypothetical protein